MFENSSSCSWKPPRQKTRAENLRIRSERRNTVWKGSINIKGNNGGGFPKALSQIHVSSSSRYRLWRARYFAFILFYQTLKSHVPFYLCHISTFSYCCYYCFTPTTILRNIRQKHIMQDVRGSVLWNNIGRFFVPYSTQVPTYLAAEKRI